MRIDDYDRIISSSKRYAINIREIWEYRDLLLILVRRDFVMYYKQTILGPIWYLIQPIITAFTFWIIFGNLAKIDTDGIPTGLFYFSGVILWNFFNENVTKSSNVFQDNKAVFSKIYFPRIIALLASSIGLLIKLAMQFAMFISVYVYYLKKGNVVFSYCIIFSPFIVLWIVVLSVGIGMTIASITTKYRDIAMVLGFALNLVMYITPVAYPISQVPEKLKVIFLINPLSVPIELFRWSFFGSELIDLRYIIFSMFVCIVLLVVGTLSFGKNERYFVDLI